MAVAAAEMIIELTITAQSSSTRMKANVAMLVKIVQIARDLRRPSLVWIIQAPTYIVSALLQLVTGMKDILLNLGIRPLKRVQRCDFLCS